jgi:membrane protease YdiL (CAAX protease family)
MVTLIVLAFPAIVFAGYGAAYALLRRRPELLTGAPGFALYCALLTIPLVAVVLDSADRLRERFEFGAFTPAWAALGVAVGLALWGARWLTARRTAGEARVWVGPPGRAGYALLMLPVAYVVAAEEVVWRGYLTPAVGLPLASAAFALHHYHFGWRHVLFAFGAGLVWGALFLLEDRLYACMASHLTYNALAWAWLRRRDSQPAP